MKNQSKVNIVLIYFFITLIALLSRLYLFEDRNSWHDEWHSIYVSDPTISNNETLERYYGDKGDSFLTEFYPPLYLYILKYFFNFFGYVDDNGRILSVIFGIITIPLSMYLTKILDKNNSYITVGLLICFNLFLTWQSIEIRAHSILVAFSILSIILFYKLLSSNSLINKVNYTIISVFLLSLWPITGAIFFGKTIFILKEYIHFKKKNIQILIIFTLIFLAYIFLNIDYLKFNLSRDFHYTSLYKSFFYNFHFRTFFGSKILGGIFLVIFSLTIIKNFRKIIFDNKKENLILYIIFSSYFLTLTYTYFRASIMSPKYVIFIVPLIIIWISINWPMKFNLKKNFLLIFFSSILFFYSIENYPIDRPPTKQILELAKRDKVKLIVSPESDVFINYLKTKKIVVENEIKIIKIENEISNKYNQFWFVCLNNVLHFIGEIGLLSNNPKPESKCTDYQPKDNFIEKFPPKVDYQDYYIRKFVRKKK